MLRSWWRAQFIGLNGGGREFRCRCAVVGKGREFLVRMNPWLTSWRPHRRRWDDPRESRWRGGKAEPRGARPRGGGSPASLSLQPQSRRGSHSESPEWPPAHRRRRFFYPWGYPSTSSGSSDSDSTNHGGESSAARSFWRWRSDPPGHCTIRIPFQSMW
jgi:hypothetical protein